MGDARGYDLHGVQFGSVENTRVILRGARLFTITAFGQPNSSRVAQFARVRDSFTFTK
jgi:hypothetical protein